MCGLKWLCSARAITVGLALVRNLRRGHYAITADTIPVDRLRAAFDELAVLYLTRAPAPSWSDAHMTIAMHQR